MAELSLKAFESFTNRENIKKKTIKTLNLSFLFAINQRSKQICLNAITIANPLDEGEITENIKKDDSIFYASAVHNIIQWFFPSSLFMA